MGLGDVCGVVSTRSFRLWPLKNTEFILWAWDSSPDTYNLGLCCRGREQQGPVKANEAHHTHTYFFHDPELNVITWYKWCSGRRSSPSLQTACPTSTAHTILVTLLVPRLLSLALQPGVLRDGLNPAPFGGMLFTVAAPEVPGSPDLLRPVNWAL